jgi:hypothetical protein
MNFCGFIVSIKYYSTKLKRAKALKSEEKPSYFTSSSAECDSSKEKIVVVSKFFGSVFPIPQMCAMGPNIVTKAACNVNL